jgi:putative membrane protein
VYRKSRIPLGLVASLVLAGMLAACDEGSNGDGGSNGDETGSAAGSTPAGGTPSLAADTFPSPITSPDLSDANVVALLDHANEADSSAGALASKKATNEQVKKFARMMMADHHRLRQQGADLARKLDLTPMRPADDPITPLAHREMDALEAAEKGLDFDRTYIQQEIAAHQVVLDLTDEAQEAAGNAELRAVIEQSRPVIENHLEQAQAIEKELGLGEAKLSSPPPPPAPALAPSAPSRGAAATPRRYSS